MSIHTFVDESRRGSVYFVAAAHTEPGNLRQLRRELRGLLLPGQRELHFKREKEPRQRAIADAISRLPLEVHVYVSACARQEEAARQACLGRLIHDLLNQGGQRLVLDSRAERDIQDERTIRRALGPRASETNFVYEHLDSTAEPLLWVADSAAWCVNAGGNWRKRIDGVVTKVINLNAPE